MNEAVEEEASWLRTLPSQERARFLAWLSHNLTIVGRVIAHSDGHPEARLEQLRQLNEIQHRVSSYIGHALGTNEDSGWLPVVVSFVLDPHDPELIKQTTYAWSETRRGFRHVP